MKNPTAKIYTDSGVITMELYPQYAPNTVNSFIWSAQQNFYKNRLIKRVVKDFVLQPSYNHFEDENCDFMLNGEFASNCTCFKNPDGSYVLVVGNPYRTEQVITVGGKSYALPPRSVNTITF